MNLDIANLPNDVAHLKSVIVDLHRGYEQQIAAYEKHIDILMEQIHLLRAQLYGRKSEKIRSEHQDTTPFLFDMPEPEEVPVEEITVPEHTRKKSGRRPLPEDLERVDRIHDIPEEEKVCACGARLKRIGEEVSEKLDIVPAKVRVIRDIRLKYACPECEGSLSEDDPPVRIAPAPPTLLPKSIATAGLLAFILTGKFVDHIPFYRQEQQFGRMGIDISRGNMSSWAIKAAIACQPLLNLCKDEILSGYCINIDETVVQVLDEPGRDARARSYMWIFRGGDPLNPVLVYEYHPSRSGDVASSFLTGYEGYVQTDGYSGYDFLDSRQGIVHIGCWAHARRKFQEVNKARGKGHKPGSADVALSYIRKLYRIESIAREQGLSAEEIYAMRQSRAGPILSEFHEWLLKKSAHTPPKGLLGKAVAYCLNQWDRLTGYLRDGRLCMDNNAAENAIRPFVVGRKNWLFSGTPEGAEASALFYSLIETAKANGLEPYSYLRYIFEKLPLAEALEDYEALLPWNLDKETLAIEALKETTG